MRCRPGTVPVRGGPGLAVYRSLRSRSTASGTQQLLCLRCPACHSSPAPAQGADSAEVAAVESTSAAVRGTPPMTQPARKEEPSMEEILASIRRIIAEDEQESPSRGAAMPQPLRPVPAMQDESTPREPFASPAPSSEPAWTERSPPSAASAMAAGSGVSPSIDLIRPRGSSATDNDTGTGA